MLSGRGGASSFLWTVYIGERAREAHSLDTPGGADLRVAAKHELDDLWQVRAGHEHRRAQRVETGCSHCMHFVCFTGGHSVLCYFRPQSAIWSVR